MQIPCYNNTNSRGFDVTPMIDVVFLLIIFFLVSSHLAKQESNIDLSLPIAQQGVDDINQQTPRVTINIKSDGSMTLAGRPIAPNQLAEKFKMLRQAKGDDIEVRVRGSRQAEYSTVEPIMLACTRAGIWNITYAVYRRVAK